MNIRVILQDPAVAYIKLLHRLSSTLLWQRLSNNFNFSQPQFILSFDCDTQEDIAVVWDVHSRLADMGITPVYAVPGGLLKKGATVYQKIYATGAEFINHGGREHTYFDTINNRHASCFFYDQQTSQDIKEDILQGHQILQDVLGIQAQGWRTPHFGTFQSKEQLQFLYSILKELNYKFSTSTIPQKAYCYGSVYQNHDIREIPVTGIFKEPLNIMDTWAYFGAPDRIKTPLEYLQNCQLLANFAAKKPILINIYGDPSHIYNQEEFFEGMKLLANVAKVTNYNQFLGAIDGNICNI